MFVQFIDKLLDDQVHIFTFQVAMPKLRIAAIVPLELGYWLVIVDDSRHPVERPKVANPVLSNLEVFPHPSVYVGQEGTRSGQAGETRYTLARALSISDHHIRR
jgi:hypothetical protein